MSIRIHSATERVFVAFLGSEPTSEASDAFGKRDLIIQQLDLDHVQETAYLNGLAAVVIPLYASSRKWSRALALLDKHAANFLDHGVEVLLVVQREVMEHVRALLVGLRLPTNGLGTQTQASWQDSRQDQISPSITIYSLGADWEQIARFVIRRRVSEKAKVSLKPSGDQLGGELILVQRAFADFDDVHLKELALGFSGARAFKAQARRGGGNTMPYFVKIGARRKIQDEFVAYENGVEKFIPFHLSPPFLKEQCYLGARSGIIIECFVTESESLLKCAEEGRGVSPIACLFGRTLNAWHRPSTIKALGHYVLDKFPTEVDPEVWDAAQTIGNPRKPSELLPLFKRCCASLEVQYGLIHGDLNANNVRVRGTDAVVIDMEKYSEGPLLWDPACLEASFLVEAFVKDDRPVLEWQASIERCFGSDLLDCWSTDHLTDESSWFHTAVGQIRLFVRAMQSKGGQYDAVLSAALLWKSAKPVGGPETSVSCSKSRELRRRGVAYLFGQFILERLNQTVAGSP
jgi:hypothetical protein